MGIFVEYGKDFWTKVAAIGGVPAISNKNLSKAVGVTSGVTPFRAFRFDNRFIVIVEPTHISGAYVTVFENREEFDTWYDQHMYIDIKNRDM